MLDLEPDAVNTDVTATNNSESVTKSSKSPALTVSVTKFYVHNLIQGWLRHFVLTEVYTCNKLAYSYIGVIICEPVIATFRLL